jgi:Bacterial proteasome activator
VSTLAETVNKPDGDSGAGDGGPEVVVLGSDQPEGGPPRESVEQPAKVMRIGSMIKQLLDEVRQAPLDDASRARLREIYETSVRELASGLSPELAGELERVTIPFGRGAPSEPELRIAQAQLVGWLEGLFHGIQATLFAQQVAARSQLDEMRRRGLPAPDEPPRPGAYL